ncbi:MAG TPA: DUF4136 domain-containing protein [Chryseosolibacter sp.]
MNVKMLNILLALPVLILAGCAVTDFDQTADFSQYKTYAWGKPEADVSNPVYRSELIDNRIRHAVENEFAKRGIVKNEKNPDFIVRFKTHTEKKEQTYGGDPYGYRYFPYGIYPYAFRWGWGYYPYPWMSPRNTKEYTEGTLVLDVIDRRSDDLVWRGSVSGNVDDVSVLKKQIAKAVKAIMKKYPVSPETPLNVQQEVIS